MDSFQAAAKEKALELYDKYELLGRAFTRGVSMKEFARQCTLIALKELLKDSQETEFWLEVKKEIEAL
jgi:hypothetical protein